MSDEKRPNRPENDPPRPERKPEERRDWEVVQKNEYDQTDRLRIVGGWLYRTVVGGSPEGSADAVALVFVPATATD